MKFVDTFQFGLNLTTAVVTFKGTCITHCNIYRSEKWSKSCWEKRNIHGVHIELRELFHEFLLFVIHEEWRYLRIAVPSACGNACSILWKRFVPESLLFVYFLCVGWSVTVNVTCRNSLLRCRHWTVSALLKEMYIIPVSGNLLSLSTGRTLTYKAYGCFRLSVNVNYDI